MDLDKLIAGCAMIITNMGAKSARSDLDVLHKTIINEEILRKLFWISLVFLATRDLVWSVFLGLTVGLATEIFHEKKRFFVLKHDYDKASRYYISKSRFHK